MSNPLRNFATLSIHNGQDLSNGTHRDIMPPCISLSPAFRQYGPAEQAGFQCSKVENYNRRCLEETIAKLEQAKYGLCFPSGMASLRTVMSLCTSGDHVICSDDIYGGTAKYFRSCAKEMGVEVTYSDLTDGRNLEKDIKPNTKLIWFETLTNPTLKLPDIETMLKVLQNYPGILTAVDNTFLSPYFQNPLKQGIDIVMHSMTKYMNGHADVLMGALAIDNETLYIRLKDFQCASGFIPSPFDCYLALRGLKTLSIRMERHMENALLVAKFLEGHPAVEKVMYPGLKSHPQHLLAKRQCSGYSGMIAFYIKGKLPEAKKFTSSLKTIAFAGSLGSHNSLIEIPNFLSHKTIPEPQKARTGITDNLIRFSVGTETIDDLLQDLDQALKNSISA